MRLCFVIMFFVFLFFNCSSASKNVKPVDEMKSCNCSGIELCFYPASYTICERQYANRSKFGELKKVLRLFEKTVNNNEESKNLMIDVGLKNIMVLLEAEEKSFILTMQVLCKMTLENPCNKEIRKKKLEILSKFNVLSNSLKKYLQKLKSKIVEYDLKKKSLVKKAQKLEKTYKKKVLQAFEESQELKNDINRISLQCKQKIEDLTFDVSVLKAKSKKMREELKKAGSCVQAKKLLKKAQDEKFIEDFDLKQLVNLKVYNGTTRNGLAGKTKKKLSAYGFSVASPASVPKELRNKYPQTMVFCLTNKPNLYAEEFFKIYFKVNEIKVKSVLPKWLKGQVAYKAIDYLIILGVDTPKKWF